MIFIERQFGKNEVLFLIGFSYEITVICDITFVGLAIIYKNSLWANKFLSAQIA